MALLVGVGGLIITALTVPEIRITLGLQESRPTIIIDNKPSQSLAPPIPTKTPRRQDSNQPEEIRKQDRTEANAKQENSLAFSPDQAARPVQTPAPMLIPAPLPVAQREQQVPVYSQLSLKRSAHVTSGQLTFNVDAVSQSQSGTKIRMSLRCEQQVCFIYSLRGIEARSNLSIGRASYLIDEHGRRFSCTDDLSEYDQNTSTSGQFRQLARGEVFSLDLIFSPIDNDSSSLKMHYADAGYIYETIIAVELSR